ncbi:unnamed protein product [Didymodactylos carnosus]|uniref:Uncharacterized protein n=1 Tax=Didymodactylos carnosus TaxID=1234261 RepID=A0A815H2A9_9BILA|nr:unnamed protein product [Didymodactylos carnosus]CAF4216124.1 unnamed protein product [Didymodactylos carnosus]
MSRNQRRSSSHSESDASVEESADVSHKSPKSNQDSWYDVKTPNDYEQNEEQFSSPITVLREVNEGQYTGPSAATATSVSDSDTSDSETVDTTGIGNNRLRASEHEQQSNTPQTQKTVPEWVNPYWDKNRDATTSVQSPWDNPYWRKNDADSTLIDNRGKIDNSHEDKQSSFSNSDNQVSSTYRKADDSKKPASTQPQYENLPRNLFQGPNMNYDAQSGKNNQSGEYQTSTNSSTWNNPYWDKSGKVNQTIKPSEQVDEKQSNFNSKQEVWGNPYWDRSNINQQSKLNASKNKSTSSPHSHHHSHLQQSHSLSSRQKSWENPYWNKQSSHDRSPSSNIQPSTKWTNPYWDRSNVNQQSKLNGSKNKVTSGPHSHHHSHSQQSHLLSSRQKSWENPYWNKQSSHDRSSSSNAQPSTKWTNPYWDRSNVNQQSKLNGSKSKVTSGPHSHHHSHLQQSHSLSSREKPWENPYWNKQSSHDRSSSSNAQPSTKGTKQQEQPKNNYQTTVYHDIEQTKAWIEDDTSPHNAPPIPSYFERIYPPPQPNEDKRSPSKPQKQHQQQQIRPSNSDNSNLPVTSKGSETIRYDAKPHMLNRATEMYPPVKESTDHQNLSESQPGAQEESSSSSTTNNNKIKNITLAEIEPQKYNYNSNLSTNSYTFTADDIETIQEALKLLQSNPDALPIFNETTPTSTERTQAPAPTSPHQQQIISSAQTPPL